ncbi:Cytochrome P450 monooxygenase COX2 [Psilocybe cubensis]|uniref:Cytochrome P450 monooxygenase COX2 n=1 Tax=Psilocybe cubensis TaxID=181762 RepID=A0ACB8GRU1_PSICU|nr:Cytochrome P450 monooxygenase COX2 [Psilocybe cubensis]KAH9478386.1 Cytochrome P450 monooxygenase COX2 [Psilocybe cubensis]
MTAMIFSICISALLLWVIKRLLKFFVVGKQRNYPPGPTPKPFIGNLLDFPTTNAALVYAEWGKKYNSPIVHAEVLGNHVVVINNINVAEELLEHPERARIYADRPAKPVTDLMGWNINVAVMPYGEEWRKRRKVCQKHFNLDASKSYEPLQIAQVRKLLQGLLDSPEQFDAHSKMFSAALTIKMMYGYDIADLNDPCVTLADEALSLGTRLVVPGANLIDIFPPLRHVPAWFPGASSQKKAAIIRRMTDEVVRLPLDYVKKSFKDGTAVPSLVREFYEKQQTTASSQEEEDIITSVAYTVYGAASDTVRSFFYLMAVNPDTQKKAQLEIDRVIGAKRLPVLADRASLPYVEAIYREVLRLRPPFPLGIPHCLMEDDHYRGYFMPKGTIVLTNTWAMSYDEQVYPEPQAFFPERYFVEGKLDKERILAYGFGRRICAGKHVASLSVWLMIASVLATFTITPRKDENGNDIEINGDIEDHGLMNHKKKFDCPILYAEALGIRFLVLNDAADAAQLLESSSRAKIYADRPLIPIVKVMGWEKNVAIMPYGDAWRQHRRVIQNNFNNPKAVQKFEPIQTKKIRQLLQGLLNTPEKFEAHSKMFSASLTIALMYGYEIKSLDEPCVTMADEALSLGARLLLPGASLMNAFPVLRHVPEWFPGASARKKAGVIRRMTDEIETGTVVPSLVADFYEKMYTVGASEVEEEMIKNVAYTVYGGT